MNIIVWCENGHCIFCENGHYIILCENGYDMAYVKMDIICVWKWPLHFHVQIDTMFLSNWTLHLYVKMETIIFMWKWTLYFSCDNGNYIFRKWIASHLMKDNIVWLHCPTYSSVLSTLSLCLFTRVWFCIFSDLLLISKSNSFRPSRPFLRHYWWCQNTSQTNPNCLGNIMVRLCCLPTGHYIISLVRKWALYNFSKNEHCFLGGNEHDISMWKWTLYSSCGNVK